VRGCVRMSRRRRVPCSRPLCRSAARTAKAGDVLREQVERFPARGGRETGQAGNRRPQRNPRLEGGRENRSAYEGGMKTTAKFFLPRRRLAQAASPMPLMSSRNVPVSVLQRPGEGQTSSSRQRRTVRLVRRMALQRGEAAAPHPRHPYPPRRQPRGCVAADQMRRAVSLQMNSNAEELSRERLLAQMRNARHKRTARCAVVEQQAVASHKHVSPAARQNRANMPPTPAPRAARAVSGDAARGCRAIRRRCRRRRPRPHLPAPAPRTPSALP